MNKVIAKTRNVVVNSLFLIVFTFYGFETDSSFIPISVNGTKSIAEETVPETVSSTVTTTVSAPLQTLSWLIGHWQFSTGEERLEMDAQWAPNGHYLVIHDTAQAENGEILWTGKRIIAWNPVSELFETWAFRDDGSFGGGLLEQYGNQWSAPIKMILADGRSMTWVNLYTPQPSGGFLWQSISRTLDGLPLPNLGPVNVPLNKDYNK